MDYLKIAKEETEAVKKNIPEGKIFFGEKYERTTELSK